MADTDFVVPPPSLLTRVSWGAIFAGTLVAVAVTAFLGLLGLGLGFAAIDPTESAPFAGVGKGALIWWGVTNVVALLLGGFVAARLAGIPKGLTGLLHGLAVWSLGLLLTLWLATTAIGAVLGAASSVVSTTARITASVAGTVGGAAVSAGEAAMPGDAALQEALREQGLTRERVRREAQEISRAAGLDQRDAQRAQQIVAEAGRDIVMNPGEAGDTLSTAVDRLFSGRNAPLSPQERQRLTEEIAARAGVTPQEAEQIADRWQAQADAAAERVTRTADEAQTRARELSAQGLDALSKAAWAAFIASLIGLLAALIGAILGAPSVAAAGALIEHRHDSDGYHDHRAHRG